MAGVRVILLGKLADLAESHEIALPAPLDWEGMLAALPEGLAEAAQDPRNRIALNGALVADKAFLAAAEGDEIALLPPVSGG